MQPSHPSLLEQSGTESESHSHETTISTRWTSVGASHVGRVRHLNEDAFLQADEENLWVVADGMGGHKRGDFASKTIVNMLKPFNKRISLADSLSDIENRLMAASAECQAAFKGKPVGSTVAALFHSNNMCFFIWAGDSRIYRLRDNTLEIMTEDHSVAQEKFARGELSAEEAATHPSAHVLTRAVGVHRKLQLELRSSPTQEGDRYLLCSDGLYNDVSFDKIHSHLTQPDPSKALDLLIEGALDKSGRDNITAVIVSA